MNFSPAEQKIYDEMATYAASQKLIFNPNAAVVERVIRGLAAREAKTGKRYCPCRLSTKDETYNQSIICPCVYHHEEIARDGVCHCHLFVTPESK